MLKRLTRKLITLSVVLFILASVSFTPASSTNQQLYCYYDIVTAECPTGYCYYDIVTAECPTGGVCCDDFSGKNCWCS
jgi:hypothetical protein